ncbi:MAG TPA: glycosyltransferase family 4 protein [Solirubrobacteraceae bacterium]|jgi:glycosyltransferase involved in cell wall biosynthesis
MRILVISNLYPPVAVGGYEIRCAHTVQWLARRHEVLVLTSRRGRRGAAREEGVLRELPFLSQDVRGSLRAPLASLRAARSVRRALAAQQPDLVFVWNASQIPRAAVRIAQRWGCAVAFSVADPWLGSFAEGDQFLRHLLPSDRGARRVWAALVRLVNRLPSLRIELRDSRPAAIVWNSEALREMTAIPPQIEPTLQRVIYPASRHEELFAGIERVPAPTPTVAFVGRIEWQKAPDIACRAVALLGERHGITARLVLAGTGEAPARRALRELVHELGIEDRVELRGALAPRDVAELLASAHALLVPSRWQEPFGLVCLEGALARVPVVASRSGGMPEMLCSEQEALFFEIDDVEGCAAALARTLAEPGASQERARRAFARAGAYSLERYRAAYDAFVEEAARA